ncbi:MAG: lipid-A-disaccharide synthase, partial [Flavobacteriaceae bacterium]|nr:lipid-A-disaccharide synthase [Flavobacteriaceae bacterium]
VVMNKTYDLLSVSSAALVTSGTATLETALFKVPQVVCYKGNILSYWIAKHVITLKYISLVNLILDRAALKELIQTELNKKNLKKALQNILINPGRTRIFEDYYELEKKLGGAGASAKTASLIVKAVKS